MDILSICIIVFFLIFMIIGYVKGFLSIMLSVCKGIASLFISYFLAKPVGDLLFNLGLGRAIGNKVEIALVNLSPLANEVVTAENSGEFVSKFLTEINMPDFLHGLINNLVGEINLSNSGETIGHYISAALASLACTVIAFVFLMLVLNLSFLLFKKIFKLFNKIPIFGKINRIIGMLVNLLFAWMIISVVFWVMALLSTFIPPVAEFTTNIFKLGQEQFTFAKWLYEHNLATLLFILFAK